MRQRVVEGEQRGKWTLAQDSKYTSRFGRGKGVRRKGRWRGEEGRDGKGGGS